MGPLTRRSARGFTLLEILVVIAILAIATAAVSLAFTGSDADAAMREARRFAGALEHAATRAQARAETLGVSAQGNAWRFWRRDADTGRWQVLAEPDDILAPHALPDGMSVRPVTYAGREIEAATIVPLRATGRNEPASFELAARDATVTLSTDPLNRIAISTVAP